MVELRDYWLRYLRHASVMDPRIRIRIHVKRHGSGTLSECKPMCSIKSNSKYLSHPDVKPTVPHCINELPGPSTQLLRYHVPYCWSLDLVTNDLDITYYGAVLWICVTLMLIRIQIRIRLITPMRIQIRILIFI